MEDFPDFTKDLEVIIFSMEKYHKQEVSPVEEENERDETFEADNVVNRRRKKHKNAVG